MCVIGIPEECGWLGTERKMSVMDGNRCVRRREGVSYQGSEAHKGDKLYAPSPTITNFLRICQQKRSAVSN